MSAALPRGVGLGWRPATAWLIDQRSSLAFSEVVAESIDPARVPPALALLRARGLVIVPHGVSLGLGDEAPPEAASLSRLRAVAHALQAPFVSEHIALVRAGGLEAGHLLPVPRTRAWASRVAEHARRAQDALGVPLVLENVAAPLRWPEDELSEPDFVSEVVERADVGLLLDVANLYANVRNGTSGVMSIDAYLDRLPLARIAYVHAAGGASIGGRWRDTHAHPVGHGALGTLAALVRRVGPGALSVLLERDQHFGTRTALEQELDVLEDVTLGRVTSELDESDSRGPGGRVQRASHAPLAAARDPAPRELLAALVGDAPDPEGFDHDELVETRAILAEKRARVGSGSTTRSPPSSSRASSSERRAGRGYV